MLDIYQADGGSFGRELERILEAGKVVLACPLSTEVMQKQRGARILHPPHQPRLRVHAAKDTFPHKVPRITARLCVSR